MSLECGKLMKAKPPFDTGQTLWSCNLTSKALLFVSALQAAKISTKEAARSVINKTNANANRSRYRCVSDMTWDFGE